ncbi:MAG: methionyl-tRNA formyltransferase [Patescibacteria group bacterium]|nr:MAG: methionyl-tRNA formyltransferase [Patescibacteria group bacterium]
MKYTIAIAGTTKRTLQCAEALLKSNLFEIVWILTPIAKPVGRKQVISPNPMDLFAQEKNIPVVYVEKKLDSSIQEKIALLPHPDLLLVVDFGYIIPNWLLQLPKIAPLNIHPSQLPKWRGSSPGQFAILFNEKNSAVTLMVMDEKLDHGPIIHQDFFAVDPTWNQEEYYQHAFELMCKNLSQKVAQFAQNPDKVVPQPESSPTIIAKQISKEQAFVPWKHIQMAQQGLRPTDIGVLSELLQQAYKANGLFPLTLDRAVKAFSPWPVLWTIVPTTQGEKRMKVLESELQNGILILKTVHIEGKNPGNWSDVKNSIYTT